VIPVQQLCFKEFISQIWYK